MMKIVSFSFFLSASALAYVPTVESLFRHGGNQDISANGISMTLIVKKIQPGTEKSSGSVHDVSLVRERRQEDFYRVFFTRSGESLKLAQSRYSNGTFSEASIEHKVYHPNFNAFTIRPELEHVEKGLFYSVLNSIALNNGAHLVNYLKALGVPVRLNSEIINREKIAYLASYKQYLVAINNDRSARKTLPNPLKPEDSASRERVERAMSASMYVDTGHVKLTREAGEMVWGVKAGSFEAIVSYKDRQIQKIRYKTQAGDYEIICRDYWLANGTHSMPRYMQIRSLNGENYQVEITNLRHYVEKEEDLIKRLKRWDELLKGRESTDPRPEFLL